MHHGRSIMTAKRAWKLGLCEAGLVLAKGARGKEKKWILNNPQRKFSRHI